MKTLSKSRYMEGLKCSTALWFNTHARPQPANTNIPARAGQHPAAKTRQQGRDIGNLAHLYFPGGVEVKAAPDDLAGAILQTNNFIKSGSDVVFEATAQDPATLANARIDVLRRVPGTDEWDMIEVKSTMTAKDYHYQDLAFQRHVFTSAGYKIRNCFLMLIERDYVHGKTMDVQKFFRLQNVNKKLSTLDPEPDIRRIIPILSDTALKPDEVLGKKCLNPIPCEHKNKCWKGVPLYSVFNVAADDVAAEVKTRTGTYDISGLLQGAGIKPEKQLEIAAHQSGQIAVNQLKLKEFTDALVYPVYYLDYETVMAAVPLYEGTKPFQQVPFQFSLHVQAREGGPVTHCGFIHQDRDDPRENFARSLIALCGDKGSIVVYNQDFEEGRNRELAASFPQHAAALDAISKRMVDLYLPFRERWLYHPDQNGSASIKAVLPSFTKLSYKNLNINNGEQALEKYLAFALGQITDVADVEQLFTDLEEYCGLDTYAMVELVNVVRKFAQPAAPNPAPSP